MSAPVNSVADCDNPCSVDPRGDWRLHPSRRSVVAAVARRLLPVLVEATVIPTALFYGVLVTLGLKAALVAALAWSYTAVGRRIVAGRQVPALLVLASIGITVRAVVFLCSGSTFIYFLQPILGTLVVAGVFALSVVVGRPLIERFANDFCPLTPDVQCRPAVGRLFRRLTFLWAGVNLLAASSYLTLLLTVPATVFVGARTLTAWVITCTGVVITVLDSMRIARAEGLATAVSPNGTLHAYVA
ncbi:MAG TPA: VC0807 family protein [Acidimicrobiales bacterium]